ncbi:MAG: hypothetical protein R3C56_03435 [Pirellulaceae bacterium]
MTPQDTSPDQRLEDLLPRLVSENDAAGIEQLIEKHSTGELARGPWAVWTMKSVAS